MKRTLSLLVLVALLALPACSNSVSAAASVNGHDISADEVTRGVQGFSESKTFRDQVNAQLTQQGGQGVPLRKGAKSAPAAFTAQWVTSLMQAEAITQIAKKRHVTASDQEVTQVRQQLAQGQSAAIISELPKWLQDEIVKTSALQLALRSSLPAANGPKQLDAAYQQFAADCPTKRLVGHILVKTAAEADNVISQLKKGDSFANVSNQVSTDSGAKAQGGLLMCEKSSQWAQLDATFRAGAEATATGQVSKPIQTQFGFHVIEVVPLTPENAKPLLVAGLSQQDTLAPVIETFIKQAKLWVNPRFGKLQRSGGRFQIVPGTSPSPKSRPANTPSSTTGGGQQQAPQQQQPSSSSTPPTS